jgi:hypothetical protein
MSLCRCNIIVERERERERERELNVLYCYENSFVSKLRQHTILHIYFFKWVVELMIHI